MGLETLTHWASVSPTCSPDTLAAGGNTKTTAPTVTWCLESTLPLSFPIAAPEGDPPVTTTDS